MLLRRCDALIDVPLEEFCDRIVRQVVADADQIVAAPFDAAVPPRPTVAI